MCRYGIDNTRFHNKLHNWGRCTSTAILILICVSILFWTLMEIFQNIVCFIFLQLSGFIFENVINANLNFIKCMSIISDQCQTYLFEKKA